MIADLCHEQLLKASRLVMALLVLLGTNILLKKFHDTTSDIHPGNSRNLQQYIFSKLYGEEDLNTNS